MKVAWRSVGSLSKGAPRRMRRMRKHYNIKMRSILQMVDEQFHQTGTLIRHDQIQQILQLRWTLGMAMETETIYHQWNTPTPR